jgi:hypothetical protein
MVTWVEGDKITADKLNAMQLSTLVEGDYDSYKFVWGRDYTAVCTDRLYINKVSNTGTVSFTDWDADVIWRKTYVGAESSVEDLDYAPFLDYNTEGFRASIQGTYYGLVDSAGTSVLIFKNDTLIQTITISEDDATTDTILNVAFSSNGRYFAVVSEVVGTSDELFLMLYEADV